MTAAHPVIKYSKKCEPSRSFMSLDFLILTLLAAEGWARHCSMNGFRAGCGPGGHGAAKGQRADPRVRSMSVSHL